jgi:hypothetical protein
VQAAEQDFDLAALLALERPGRISPVGSASRTESEGRTLRVRESNI